MRSMGFGRFEPTDDRALAQHLHGVLRRAKVPTGDLTLEVVDGVVRVRGEITDASDAAVVLSALASEPGVERIENLMHTRGQVAPNKAAGLQASAWAAGHR